ncbi:PAS domain S-box-containing protein/diguanylate cyclase (GGDEF) domain-containing protein [Pelagirhabdus alkalitolerans]|uniref:PAS domain S-box-containing protein/diguanylate cyclase (GGDEF) domain-containing protein n=1 Tax=Pelagirhabdus alkalitolerans TaxID=1612202 RepID=A0A1G6NAK4_9BACI|nr:diguanylate cyclase [Pelagirhabdus alkalitolerans]SDC64434.1 PAS domain S-box-containing protein/diguanylate cyclase (GGDEF) domain-containing protein [Pelagirhabdus alkalitolerans]
MELSSQKIIDGMTDMVFVMRVDHQYERFIYEAINQKAKEELPLLSESIGLSIDEVNPPVLASILNYHYQKVLTTNEPIKYIDDYFVRENETKASETTLTPVFNHDVITHIVGVVKDITSLKQAEVQNERSKARLKQSRKRYKALFDENTDAIAYLNLSGDIIRMNNACRVFVQQFDQSGEDKNIFSLLKAGDLKLLLERFNEAKNQETVSVDLRHKTMDHVPIIIQVKFIPYVLDDQTEGIYCIIKDMTAEVTAKEALMQSEERFRLIAEHSSDLIQLVDHKEILLYASPSHESILGYDDQLLEQRSLLELVSDKHHTVLVKHFNRSKEKNETERFEVQLKTRDDRLQWFELQIEPIEDQNGRFNHFVVVGRDVEERKAYEEKLQYFAYHDPLTGVANRRLLSDRLEQVVAFYKRNQIPFAMIMIDIDDFKVINDDYGHDAGDVVIQEVAKRLQGSVREVDTVSRFGGDEFAILLPEIDTKENLSTVLVRIESMLQKPYLFSENNHFNIGISLGVYLHEDEQVDALSVLSQADHALYDAKRAGKNRTIIKS